MLVEHAGRGEGGRSSAISGRNARSPLPEPALDIEARLVRWLLQLLLLGPADINLPRADPCLENKGRSESTLAPSLLASPRSLLASPRARLPADPSGLRGVEGFSRLHDEADEGT
jgi:hypothetical protein